MRPVIRRLAVILFVVAALFMVPLPRADAKWELCMTVKVLQKPVPICIPLP